MAYSSRSVNQLWLVAIKKKTLLENNHDDGTMKLLEKRV